MSFQLSPHTDKNKIFFVRHSELQDRLDPLFYIALENIKNNIEKKAKYHCVNLIQTCSINRGRFGHRPRNDPRFYDGEYPFIQTGDIVEASDSKTQIKYTQTLNELGLKTSKLFHPPKLLFTIAANIGDTAILDYSSCFPDSIVALIPKKDDITLEYLNIYLKLIKSYVVELAPYSAQRNLNNQQLAQVPIVIPPKEVQEEIIAKMDTAYAAKKQKEEEAQRLLDSIDDYLLSELGINLPEPEENTIQNRVFYRKLSDVSGNRFDCNYNSKIILLLSQESKYKISHLKNLLVKSPQYGANEIAIHKNSVMETTYIRITDIDDFGYLKKDDLKTASIIEDQYILNKNDLLFARSGSVGRCYLHQDDTNKSIFAGYLIRFILNPEIANHYYIFYYCHSKVYKMWVDAVSRSAVQSNINSEEYKFLPIFLPPLEKQLEIVDRITTIRTQAKQLRQAAAAELEQAKQEVEAMILGES